MCLWILHRQNIENRENIEDIETRRQNISEIVEMRKFIKMRKEHILPSSRTAA